MTWPGAPSWESEKDRVIADTQWWLGHEMTMEEATEVRSILVDDPDVGLGQGGWRFLASEFAKRHDYGWAGNQIAGIDLWMAAQALLGENWVELETA